MRTALLLCCGLFACGPATTQETARQPLIPPVPQPPKPSHLLVTIVSGSVDGNKADGSPWDVKKSSTAWAPQADGPLALFVQQHPELDGAEATLGESVELPSAAAAANESPAADPMVLVEIAGRIYRSPVRGSQFQPVWQFPFVADVWPSDLVKITVVDWDGPGGYDVIGEKVLSGADLIGKRVLELPRFGNVAKLTVTVEDAPPLAASHRVAVPGRPTWTATGISVVAGSEVTIIATGEVCAKGEEKCAGPEGSGKPSESSQVRGFEGQSHLVLIGAVGDTRFVIGREKRFVAPSSGSLLLGVNDSDAGNNKGEFEVAVTIK